MRARGMEAPWRGIAAVVLSASACLLPASTAGAETSSALRVELTGAPQRVHGSDGREHVEYDLVVTDAFPAEVRLRSLAVRGGGHRLLALSGAALGDITSPLAAVPPSDLRIAPASSALVQVDLALPRSAGRRAPARLLNRIRYSVPADAPVRPIIGSTTVRAPARVERRGPVVIAAPLRGGGWIDGNGCCNDPTSPHRSTVLPTSSGRYNTPETFAIDWSRLAGGLLFRGDGSRNADWPTFGSPVHAVADGTVVRARDGLPDIPPMTANPGLRTPRDFAGNSVILRLGEHRYACYAHFQHGSVRVRRGDRVRVGQRIARAGNSGNTTGPHLHFGIQRTPDCLGHNEPFEIDAYRQQGVAGPASAAPMIDVVGPARRERRSLPLIRSVIRMGPPARARP